MWNNKPDKLLGIHTNMNNSGYSSSKDYRRMGKKDNNVNSALIVGNLSHEEAALLGLIIDIAGDDPGTCEAVLHHIAISKGVDGRAERLAVMVDTGTVALPWEPLPDSNRQNNQKKDKSPVPVNGHNSNGNQQYAYEQDD